MFTMITLTSTINKSTLNSTTVGSGSVSAISILMSSKEMVTWHQIIAKIADTCKEDLPSLKYASSTTDLSEDKLMDLSQVAKKLVEDIHGLVRSDLNESVKFLCGLMSRATETPEFLKQQYPDVDIDEKSIVLAACHANTVLLLIAILEAFATSQGNSLALLKALSEKCAHLSHLAEALNRTPHVGRRVLQESVNPDSKEANSVACSNASNDPSSNEGETTAPEQEQSKPTNFDRSTTKHATAQEYLYEHNQSAIEKNIMEGKQKLKKLKEAYANSTNHVLQEIKDAVESAVPSAKAIVAKDKGQRDALKQEIIQQEQAIANWEAMLAEFRKANGERIEAKSDKPSRKVTRRIFGDKRVVGSHLAQKGNVDSTIVDDGIEISASVQLSARTNWVYLFFASLDQQLEIESRANDGSIEVAGNETCLVKKRNPAVIASWVKFDMFIPDANKAFIMKHGWYKEKSSCPEELYPITPSSKMSIGGFTYLTAMQMAGATPYSLRNYKRNYGKSNPEFAGEGNSTYSNNLAVVDKLILAPSVEALIQIVRNSKSVGLYVDEGVSIINALLGMGHISQEARERVARGDYANMPKTQYSLTIHCDCLQDDGSVIKVVLMQHIGGRSTNCIYEFLQKVFKSEETACKVEFIFTDAYQAYKEIAIKLGCEWANCLVHNYRLFVGCFKEPYELVVDLHQADTDEKKAEIQAKLDNILSHEEIQVGIHIMGLLQAILTVDRAVIDEVNKLYPKTEHHSPAYLNELRARRIACRTDVILPYFEQIRLYCVEYFGHLIDEDKQRFTTTPLSSDLEDAIKYLLKHWDQLTRFAHSDSMDSNNNRCEQYIKKSLLPKKMRRQNFQSVSEAERHFNMQSVWQTLEANYADQFEFFSRMNHITLMSMVAFYTRERFVESRPVSLHAQDGCKFKEEVVSKVNYLELMLTVLKTKHLPLQDVYEQIARVATTPFSVMDGVKLAQLNEEKLNKRQYTIHQKLAQKTS